MALKGLSTEELLQKLLLEGGIELSEELRNSEVSEVIFTTNEPHVANI